MLTVANGASGVVRARMFPYGSMIHPTPPYAPVGSTRLDDRPNAPELTELSPFHMHRRHLHPTVHRIQDAIVTEPQRDWDMASLAHVGHAAERHLLRLFIDHAGISPLQYLRLIRLERARQSLEYGATVTRAAAVAGFSPDL